jgi:hypothetical protein
MRVEIGVHVNFPIVLPDFSKKPFVSIKVSKTPKYQISLKIRSGLLVILHTEKWTERNGEANTSWFETSRYDWARNCHLAG